MKKRIYINRLIIDHNRKFGENRPPISIRTSNSVRSAYGVEVNGTCRLIYSPKKPLPCGATVWLETDDPVKIKRKPSLFSLSLNIKLKK